MSGESAEMRRQAQQARVLSADAMAAARRADPLAAYLPRLVSAVEGVIGSSASGADRQMTQLLATAERHQRAAGEQCRAAAQAAQSLAARLEAEAVEAERREEAERRSKDRTR